MLSRRVRAIRFEKNTTVKIVKEIESVYRNATVVENKKEKFDAASNEGIYWVFKCSKCLYFVLILETVIKILPECKKKLELSILSPTLGRKMNAVSLNSPQVKRKAIIHDSSDDEVDIKSQSKYLKTQNFEKNLHEELFANNRTNLQIQKEYNWE